ncbi:MAG TPA: thiamine phosphate synthase [Candidatus Latescibacteria bacterium]|nr:thiamine phosphate synthase [Candidatus Latescibacterota bacterium]
MNKTPVKGLYLITDSKLTGGRPLTEIVEAAIKGGVKVVQYREKDLSEEDMIRESRRLLEVTKRYGVPLIINDHVKVAISIGADGVHLGQEDMSVEKARKMLKKDRLIGISTHSLDEALYACNRGADYIGVGPIYVDSNIKSVKPDVKRPVGVELITRVKAAVPIPVIAIGGINRENISEVVGAGADGIAVIRAIFGAEDPYKAALELAQICNPP